MTRDLPSNLWELMAWMLVYRDSIYVRRDGSNVALKDLEAEDAAATIAEWIRAGRTPVRVTSDNAFREELRALTWRAISLADADEANLAELARGTEALNNRHKT